MRLNYKDISQYVHSENRAEPILKICRKSSVFRQEGIPAERLLTLLCPSVCTCKPGLITNYTGPAGIFPETFNDAQPLQLPFGSNNFNEHFTQKQANISALISVSIRSARMRSVCIIQM
jgi:hypothetical protein